jgi:hypothetical protein
VSAVADSIAHSQLEIGKPSRYPDPYAICLQFGICSAQRRLCIVKLSMEEAELAARKLATRIRHVCHTEAKAPRSFEQYYREGTQ